MNENKSEVSQEFRAAYPYLSDEYDRVEKHESESDLSSIDAMRICAQLPFVRARLARTGGDTFLDIPS
jgi:hypothetical protein